MRCLRHTPVCLKQKEAPAMRWTRLIVFLLFLSTLGWLWWWLSPAIQPILVHPPKSGALSIIILNFFPPPTTSNAQPI